MFVGSYHITYVPLKYKTKFVGMTVVYPIVVYMENRSADIPISKLSYYTVSSGYGDGGIIVLLLFTNIVRGLY